MGVMDGMDAAMMTGDALTSPMHVAVLMIFTPPDDAGPHYLDDLYRAGLEGAADIDPPVAPAPPHRARHPSGCGHGGRRRWTSPTTFDD